MATETTEHVELPITGMTCASCANRIERKLNKLDGVTASVNYATEKATVDYNAVAVDLPTGAVTVTSGTPLDRSDVRSAVEVAGYRLTAERPAGDRDRTETIR